MTYLHYNVSEDRLDHDSLRTDFGHQHDDSLQVHHFVEEQSVASWEATQSDDQHIGDHKVQLLGESSRSLCTGRSPTLIREQVTQPDEAQPGEAEGNDNGRHSSVVLVDNYNS